MPDENTLIFKILAALTIFAIGMGGAATSRSLRASEALGWLALANCFAGGIFIGAGLIHTLADSAGLFTSLLPDLDFPLWAAIAAFSVAVLLWIDQSLSSSESGSGGVRGFTLFIVLSLHSLLAGAALGLEPHPMQAIAILLAILAHKGSASFALGLQTNESGYWRRMTMFSLMTPLGVIGGTMLLSVLQNQNELYFEAAFDAVAAGTFIYVAVAEILPKEMSKSQQPHKLGVSALAGLALMAMLALYT